MMVVACRAPWEKIVSSSIVPQRFYENGCVHVRLWRVEVSSSSVFTCVGERKPFIGLYCSRTTCILFSFYFQCQSFFNDLVFA